jgi:hypothetical protein
MRSPSAEVAMRRSLAALAFTVALFATAQGAPAPASAAIFVGDATYAPGWNLVGGPAGTMLSGAYPTLYTRQYRDTRYETIAAPNGLTGGLGYWAYFAGGGSASLPDGGPCVVAVPIGAQEWVMVGNQSPAGTATVRGAERVYTYDPASGYSAGVTLKPGRAAWAYSSVATTVAIVVDGCPTANSVPPSPPVPPPGG